MRPNVDSFKDTKLHIERDGIVVTSKMETNIKDVYAVGDCAQFTSAITGKVTSGKLATNAVPMARLLAKNLNGEKPGVYGLFSTAVRQKSKTAISAVQDLLRGQRKSILML